MRGYGLIHANPRLRIMSEAVIIALIAIASPIIVGLAKEILASRKVKADGLISSLATHEKHNEFLNHHLQEFRTYHEQQMDAWRERYEKLQTENTELREKALRLEFQLERAKEAAECEDDQPPQTKRRRKPDA